MSSAKRAPGWWYPWIFVVGMGVVIVVNVGLVYFAVGTFSGLETDNHYRKGLVYNENLAGVKAQAERGWKMKLDVPATPADARAFDAQVVFTDKEGRPLDGLKVSLMAERPTHQGHDARAEMEAAGNGVYKGSLPLALPGQWSIRIVADRGAEHFQVIERIQVQ